MVRSSRALIAAVLALCVGGAAAAEPIAVEYFIVRKDFKKGATSTDVLLFELFSGLRHQYCFYARTIW